MKFIFTLILLFGLNSFAGAEEQADEGQTDAAVGAVNACFGGCDKDEPQQTLTTSPYMVDEKIKEVMTPRGVITPEQLQKGKATNENKPIGI